MPIDWNMMQLEELEYNQNTKCQIEPKPPNATDENP